jgi:BirA family biotin operon repressor/biotin-[acetyl-CoA-carboxylase] ligase
VRAIRQTAGRGRHGRAWTSHPANLAASVLVRSQPGDPPAGQLGLVAGLALFEAVATQVAPRRLMLKWPNDLLLDGAKLSGILAERQGNEIVIGFGVNLGHAPELPDRRTIALGPGAPLPEDFLGQLAACFATALATWRREGLAPIRRDWEARAHPRGTPLVAAGPPRQEGRFHGLADDGALALETDAGLVTVHGGEVALAGGKAG